MKNRRTVSVDFDGVLHSYTTPWVNAHTIPDPPVVGAIMWLSGILQHFDVVIHSTRGNTWRGRRAMRAWLREHAGGLWYPDPASRGLEEVRISKGKKPPALIHVDDRAWRFEGPGTFPTREDVWRAKPWNKR